MSTRKDDTLQGGNTLYTTMYSHLIIEFGSILVRDISFNILKPSGFLRLELDQNIFAKRI
jgi:hypothetical protein